MSGARSGDGSTVDNLPNLFLGGEELRSDSLNHDWPPRLRLICYCPCKWPRYLPMLKSSSFIEDELDHSAGNARASRCTSHARLSAVGVEVDNDRAAIGIKNRKWTG
jgi:hypothetical protein